MNWRDRYRQRDKKRAAEVPATEFVGLLDPTDEFPSAHFLMGDEEQGYMVCVWHRERGLLPMRSHDNALYYALVEYLVANEGLRFSCREEVVAFAQQHGWSQLAR